MPRHPILQSIVLADRVYIDSTTDKKVIAGTFHRIRVPQTPAVLEETTYLYLCFREVRSRDAVVIEFVDNNENAALLEFEPIRLDIMPEPVEIILPLTDLPLPHAGAYSFDVFSGNQCLGAFRLYVTAEEETGITDEAEEYDEEEEEYDDEE